MSLEAGPPQPARERIFIFRKIRLYGKMKKAAHEQNIASTTGISPDFGVAGPRMAPWATEALSHAVAAAGAPRQDPLQGRYRVGAGQLGGRPRPPPRARAGGFQDGSSVGGPG